MKYIAFLISCSFISLTTIAQTATCEVAVDSLKGTYEGQCEKGKANGEGKAKGVDTYEGTFKNGYPDGKGTYIWKNGDYYTGGWKKGLKEGKGEMHTYVEGKDSAITGYWKKDVYKGEYEHPYVIYTTTSDVGRVQVTKMKSAASSITVEVQNPSQGGSLTQASTLTRMTDVQVVRGNYMSKASTPLSNKEVTIFQTVVFPFKATFFFSSGSSVDMEIFEDGAWTISVPINK